MGTRTLRDLVLSANIVIPVLATGVAPIHDATFGYMLPAPPECRIWWCEATYKVGRQRPLPTNGSTAIVLAAARNEYEPFQLVFSPSTTLTNVTVSVNDLIHAEGPVAGLIAATNIEMLWVDYVPLEVASDTAGSPGPYPDPLPPLSQPFIITNGQNQPLWFTIYVPRDAKPGSYEANIAVQTERGGFTIPLRLHVFNFALSDITHTRTAYGVTLDNRWHGLRTMAEFDAVWDLYMQNFRRHRISPYMPHLRAAIKWQFISTSNGFSYDFRSFTVAMNRYLDEFNFTSFRLLNEPWTLGGYARFSPEFNHLYAKLLRPILTYLREQGWSDTAYTYWIDEPDLNRPEMVTFVQEGMRAHLDAVPDLHRLLTHGPDPRLHNLVNIWVPRVGETVFHPDAVSERLSLAEEVWWFVATYPKWPVPNNFIDHPAIAPRIRAWMAETYGLTGELYWHTTYYLDRSTGNPVDPWQQTTLYTPTGEAMGNGDGVLLYPPARIPPTSPLIAGPISSLRWEMLREAMEDREYFWLLNQLLRDRALKLGPNHPAILEGKAARQAALGLVTSLTTYVKDPQVLYAARARLAAAIEALDGGMPRFVRQPKSRAVNLGDTVVLRVEALGWPLPVYQWRFEGTNLPGATRPWLGLTNIGPEHIGAYSVLASNVAGVIASTEARLVGYFEPMPRFISQPSNQVHSAGGNAVFVGTAVSTGLQTYQWLRNGCPFESPHATNAVLLITNLAPAHAGLYSLVVSNSSGVITSTPASLVVLSPPSTNLLVSWGEIWRYNDAGVAPGNGWQEVDFEDSAWPQGSAPLGYGEPPEKVATLLATMVFPKPNTVYFRRQFLAPSNLDPGILLFQIKCDDGAAVYLNGKEVYRFNLPEGHVTYETAATMPIEGADELGYITFCVSREKFLPGTNLLAGEVHQSEPNLQPLAFWTLDEIAPPWRDSVGGHDFHPVGPTVGPVQGRVGGAVTTGGSLTSWLETPDAPALRYLGPFTVGGWFVYYQSSGNDPETVCLEKKDEFRLYYAGTAINRFRFRVGNVEVEDQTRGTQSGQWRFVVAWFDGTNACIQVDNGVTYSTNAPPPVVTTNSLVTLKRTQPQGGFAADEVFFYKRVLFQGERSTIYATGLRAVLSTYVEDMQFDLALTSIQAQPPAFTDTPTSLVRRIGETAAFQLSAYSATPVNYQWQLNGEPIIGATNTLLFLSDLTTAQAGLYTLVASNLGGSATSAPGSLVVIEPPLLTVHPTETGAGWEIFLPASKLPTALLVSSNLTDWEPILYCPPMAGGTNWPLWPLHNFPQRYYRLRVDSW